MALYTLSIFQRRTPMRHRFSLLLVLVIALLCSTIQSPTPLVAQDCTDEAELVEQTLDPAGEAIALDTTFTVSWTLRNSGDCTWDRTYRLVFVSGERMDSPRTSRLRQQVEPGDTLTLSLDLTAPSAAGEYAAIWHLRAPDSTDIGPALELTIQVGEGSAESTEVILPEVLVFGGLGAGGDIESLSYCLDGGALPDAPTLIVDDESMEYRYATLYICSLSEGTEITVEVTNPEGDIFLRTYVEDAPATFISDDEREHTGTVLVVPLTWLVQAPNGDWVVKVTSEELNEEIVLTLPEPLPSVGDEEFAQIDNVPLSPIDPFATATACHYLYTPGQEMMVSGQYLPPNATLHLGIYQERLWQGYLVAQETVQTDAEGSFELSYAAPEPGKYNLVVLEQVNPEGYLEDGIQYEMYGFSSENSAFSCFTVAPESTTGEEVENHWQLLFASGQSGQANVTVLDMETGEGYNPTSAYDGCDASEGTWWPDGVWLLYQTNCATQESADGTIQTTIADYDLYARQIDRTYMLPEEETLSRLTTTPDLDETEPDVNQDGLIVYRQTPIGTSLEERGELWLLNIFDETHTPVGVTGRAPVWSPDGTRVAFMSDEEGSWQIYYADLVEGTLWIVSEGCTTHCRFPAWSPDGEQLIYEASASLEDLTPAELWIAPAGEGTPRRWLSGAYGRPSWSAEGWIAFSGPDGIYRAKAGRRPVVERYLYSDPAVTPYWAPVWSR
jgi:hypothetical protein